MGRNLLWRLAPLIILLGAGIAAWALGLGDQLTLDALRGHRESIAAWQSNPGTAVILAVLFVLVYAVVAATLPPGAALMVTAAGFFFGFLYGSTLAMTGAVLGTLPSYFAARTAVGRTIEERGGPKLKKVMGMLEDNAFMTILTFRFLPVIPYFFLNMAAGLARVPLPKYFAASLIGLVPATLTLVALGAGAGEAISAGEELNLTLLARPGILAPLIVIGLLTGGLLVFRVRSAYLQRHGKENAQS